MRTVIRFLGTLAVVALVVFGAAWWWAGRAAGPAVDLKRPEKFIGRATSLELSVQAPDGQFSRVDVALEQNGQTHQVFTLEQQGQSQVKQEAADRLYVMRPVGKLAIPELKSGKARLTVRAARPVLYGLRQAETVVTRDVEVRLEPPQVSPVSTFHYVNHGGSEFVVYRVTPEGVASGVRVGDHEYPGFPAKGAGITSDPALRVAFFALLYDQDLKTPIQLFARDEAGNEGTVGPGPPGVPEAVRQEPHRAERCVPAARRAGHRRAPARTRASPPTTSWPASSRSTATCAQKNNAPGGGAGGEDLAGHEVQGRVPAAGRFPGGGQVRRHPHLRLQGQGSGPPGAPGLRPGRHGPGADRRGAHRGTVVHAGDLGIYGNCVVVDHGLGVQSLYGHLSSIGVKVGDSVEKGQTLGRSGMTGLAGGDHLHFTMLVGGQQVTPVDWWSKQWMEDRVLRKITAAGGTP